MLTKNVLLVRVTSTSNIVNDIFTIQKNTQKTTYGLQKFV